MKWFVRSLLAGLALAQPSLAQTGDPLVFAAASLKNALDDAAAEWSRQSGKKVTISYGASSALAKQIEAGAPAQMFISADLDWMNYLAEKNLIRPETRSKLRAARERLDKELQEEALREKKEEIEAERAAAKKKAEEERLSKLSAAEQKKVRYLPAGLGVSLGHVS